MKVKDLMSIKPMVAYPETSFYKVWKIIFEKKVSCLPIVNKKNVLLGIISEEDLIERFYPSYEEFLLDPFSAKDFEAMESKISDVSHLKAEDIMNKNIFTTKPDTPLMKAASTMLVNVVSCLPVVNKINGKNKLVGIICKGDVFSYLFLHNALKK